MLEIVVGLSLVIGASACSRTEDGSVVIPRHLDMRRMWQSNEPSPSSVVGEDPVFPVAPVSGRSPDRGNFGFRRDRRHQRANAVPADTSSATRLACHEPSGSDGRIRMLCD